MNTKGILAITGATGEVGSRVARRLADQGVAQRLIVRDPQRAPQLPGAEIVQAAAYGDAAAMGRALRGVETLFLVSAHDKASLGRQHPDDRPNATTVAQMAQRPYDRVQQQTTAIDAALAVGVQRIVYLSFMSAAADATFLLARDHFHCEEHIRTSGAAFTILRMSLYADLVPTFVGRDNVIREAAGEGRAAWVARDDLADVAAAVLTGSGHDGKIYDVTGPEALTMAQTAEQLSQVFNRPIRYEMLTPPEARAAIIHEWDTVRREETGVGFDEYEVEARLSHFLEIATGELCRVSDTIPKLTGHPAQTLADCVRQHPEYAQHLVGKNR